MQEREKGSFDEYAGQHVAVLAKKVLGASCDPALLRRYLAEKYHVDPERLVFFYMENW
jgi:hypothetical protein